MTGFRLVPAARLSVLTAVLLIASCEQGGELKSGFGPPPDESALDPQTISVLSPNDTTTIDVAVQLRVVGYNAAGDTVPLTVDWTASGGTVSSTGLFTASSPGNYTVRATDRPSRRGRPEPTPPLRDSVRVVVMPGTPLVTGVTISPGTATLTPGATQTFSAQASWSDGTTRPAAATWSATGGSVSSTGVFTAGSVPGDFEVVATDTGGLADTATVTIAAATLVQVILSPATVSLSPGSTQQFQATSVFSDGSSAGSSGIAFTATGGTIDGSGLYTAGNTTGQFQVVVQHLASGLADTSSVGIGVPAPTLTSIVLAPASATLEVAEQVTFSASGNLSDGTTTAVSVTYAATGGSITAAGRYTAGTAPGSYGVIATHQSGLADTAAIVIQSPTLVSLNLSPNAVSLDPGGLQQFAVSGQLSNGQSTVPSVSYQATGGSINGSGVYTAGATPGGYRVIATASNGIADTSSITINTPVVVSVAVTPASVSLNTGATRSFTATGTLNTGGTTSVTVAWSATGGSITTAGVYTAGSSTGLFRVVATEQSQGVSDTAVVQIQAAPTLQSIAVTPATVSLQTGASQQFSATGNMSDGSNTTVTVAWSATGGSISGGGLYSAGNTAGSYQVIATHASGLADTAAVTVVAPGNSTITLQPGTTYQTMLGWEATAQIGQHEFNSQTNPGGINFQDVRDELLDKTVNELGINRVRLETNPGIERTEDIYAEWQSGIITRQGWKNRAYNPTNDNNDPFVINPAGFHFSEIDADIIEVINPMRALLAANGETLYVNLCFVDFGGLSHFVATNPDEYAELMLAIFQHLQSTYGWVPDAIEMILEPDNTPTYSGVQIGRNIAATQGRLQAAGFFPDFVAPSTTAMQSAPRYFDDIITVPGALDALSEISYHRYSTSLSSLQQIAARGTTYNKQTSHLEWIGASHLELLEDLTVGNVSSWSQFTIAWYFSDGAASDGGGTYYNVDDTNINNPIVVVGRRTPFLQQYMQQVRRGAVRIGATSQSSTLQPTAFINTDGRYVVVVKADAGLGFTVGGLPGGTYGISYTTDAQANVDQPDVTITAGTPLSASIPAAGVITIYRR